MSDRRYLILIEVENFSDIEELGSKVRKPGTQIFVTTTKRFYYWNTEEQSFLPTQSSSGGGGLESITGPNIDNSDPFNPILEECEPIGAAATAEQNAKDYADTLAVNYDPAGSADTAEQNAKDYADTLVIGLWDDRGNYTVNASGNINYPSSGGSGTAGAILKGDIWTTAGAVKEVSTVNSIFVENGDTIRAVVDSPSPTNNAHWAIGEANLGYSPENIVNKVISQSKSTTQYLAGRALSSLYWVSDVAPTVTDDSSEGFVDGQSKWYDTVTGITYKCIDATIGAAVWIPIGSVQFSLSLSAANLASGSRFDVPQLVELPAGYMWNIINVVVDYIYGTEDYDSLSLSIEVVGADTIAFDDAGTIGGAHNSMTFLMQPYYNQGQGTMKATGKVRVSVGGSPTTGDGTVKIYGLAQVIKLI